MGVWRAEKTISLDNLTGFWAPDTHLVYGDAAESLGLSDTRTILHDQRFLLTTNDYDPKVYQVTKVVEVSPMGLYKYSIKQDEYNPKRDNIKLRVCDYYTNMGDIRDTIPDENLTDKQFTIVELYRDENDELVEYPTIQSYVLKQGETTYYQAKMGTDKYPALWEVKLIDPLNEYDETETKRLENLIKLISYSDNVISVKPMKAHSIVGKRFELVAKQNNGNYQTSFEWEVG
jgi:hypothetical protein